MDTLTLPAGLNPDLLAAYAADPSNYDLLGVLADAADELDRPLVADALRWLWAKKLTPQYDLPDWCGWWLESSIVDADGHQLPSDLFHRTTSFIGAAFTSSPKDAIYRLIQSWTTATAEERQRWWQWTPPDTSR